MTVRKPICDYKKPNCFFVFLVLFSLALPDKSSGQRSETYYFAPDYTLPGNAKNHPGTAIPYPKSRFQQFKARVETPDFKGRRATEILGDFIDAPLAGMITMEFALVHHFNNAAGLVFYFKEENSNDFCFSYYAEKDKAPAEIGLFDLANGEQLFRDSVFQQYQNYWHHFVLRFYNDHLSVFHNGKILADIKLDAVLQSTDLRVAAYLQDEPHGKLVNLIDYLTIYRGEESGFDAETLFDGFRNKVANGWIYNEQLHFNVAPYLHYSTDTSINIVWETSEHCDFELTYGEELPPTETLNIQGDKSGRPFIYETRIGGLRPDQKYFYHISATSASGTQIESGMLTFKTAPAGDSPILFGVIGDTETRPHINDIVSRKLWAERPEFVLLLGDLTDGGMQHAKWQWNLEYFTGVSQLFSRIPVFPVPGNGEGDLYWYRRYHKLPGNEAYYTFSYANTEFFMLNSNTRGTEFSTDGTQYRWLDSALAKSTKAWKFVALHHAPYSTDENDYGDSYRGSSNLGDEHVKQLIPLFEKHDVDVVFFGHLHSYNRIGPIRNNNFDSKDGVWYIQAGGAGGNLEDFAPTRSWFSQKNYAGHHYCTVAVLGDQLHMKTYDLSGRLIDHMTIAK
jgi:Icc-related predicted phosphoesterase